MWIPIAAIGLAVMVTGCGLGGGLGALGGISDVDGGLPTPSFTCTNWIPLYDALALDPQAPVDFSRDVGGAWVASQPPETELVTNVDAGWLQVVFDPGPAVSGALPSANTDGGCPTNHAFLIHPSTTSPGQVAVDELRAQVTLIDAGAGVLDVRLAELRVLQPDAGPFALPSEVELRYPIQAGGWQAVPEDADAGGR